MYMRTERLQFLCYFCGKHVYVLPEKATERDFYTPLKDHHYRSRVVCRWHWQKLRKLAPPREIEIVMRKLSPEASLPE